MLKVKASLNIWSAVFVYREMEEAKRLEILEKEAEEQARLRKEKKENLRKRKENHKVPEKTEEELRGYSQIQIRELTEDDAIRPAAQKVRVLKFLIKKSV